MEKESSGNSNTEEESSKTDETIELVEDAIELGQELGEDIKQNQARKDSIYQANRDNWWVYSIGNKAEDVKNLTWQHDQIQHVEGLAIFKTSNKKYFLFQKQSSSRDELEKDISIIEEQMGDDQVKVEVVDLVADCSRKKEVVQIDDVKLGKGKNKVFLPCFSCER